MGADAASAVMVVLLMPDSGRALKESTAAVTAESIERNENFITNSSFYNILFFNTF